MLAIQQKFLFLDFINTFISLLAAFVFGSLIGIEREYRRQVAGLRTNVLVAVGAAIFVDLAMRVLRALMGLCASLLQWFLVWAF